jgi:hypothetical protein
MTSQVQSINPAIERLERGKDVELAFLPFGHMYVSRLRPSHLRGQPMPRAYTPLTSGSRIVSLAWKTERIQAELPRSLTEQFFNLSQPAFPLSSSLASRRRPSFTSLRR